MVKAHNLYKKTTISKKPLKTKKIRPFEVLWFFKNHKKQNLKNHLFHP